jgi:hypothetical protein
MRAYTASTSRRPDSLPVPRTTGVIMACFKRFRDVLPANPILHGVLLCPVLQVRPFLRACVTVKQVLHPFGVFFWAIQACVDKGEFD